MSQVIDLTRIILVIANLCNNAIFCKNICEHGLTVDNNLKKMCTLHDFISSKIRFIHTSTVTG